MPSYSKYNEIRRHPVPKRKRSIKIAGSGEDDGKWYRCWNCGFINNVDRNLTGDGNGNAYEIGVIPSTYPNGQTSHGDTGTPLSINMNLHGRFVMLNTTGLIFSERHNVGSYAERGCSFCGCENYR